MDRVRQPAVSGMFYPADRDELSGTINSYLEKAHAPAGPVPKAIIAPHAGYIYSGPIAATAYSCLVPAAAVIRRVVLLGPSHRVPFYGLAVSTADAFMTPLGSILLDRPSIDLLLTLPQVKALDEAHRLEHSLEVQLPFLQRVLHSFTLVPVVVGEASPQEVSETLDLVWGGPETLIVISSDLSHYQDYATAQRLDRATSDAIERLDCAAIDQEQACGCNPVKGLLYNVSRHRLRATTVDLRNSGDTAGPRDQVVGYGAYVFTSYAG